MPRTEPWLIEAAAPELTGSLTIQGASEGFELAPIEAADGDKPKGRKFSMTAYTGAAMRLGWGPPVVVDLSGMTVPRQDLPILRQHSADLIVGHTTGVEVTAQRVRVSGLISGVGEAAQEVQALAANGFPWQASIGAEVTRSEFVEQGQAVKVNGRTFQGPVVVARAVTLREVSFVPMGADGATSATVAAQLRGNPMQFEQWLAAKGFDPAALTDAQRNTLKAAFDAENKPAEKPAATVAGNGKADDLQAQIDAQNAALAANMERVAAINAKCEAHPAIAAKAIKEGWTVERAELEALRAARPEGPAIASGARPAVTAQVLEAAVMAAGRAPDLERRYKPEVLDAAHKEFKGRIGLQELLLNAARVNGYHGSENVKANIPDVLRAAFSTADVSGILSNTANKFLLMGYMSVDNVWSRISSRRNASDFKTMTSYRMTGAFVYDKVGATGELKHGSIGEASFTNKVDTYGKMFAVTRQDIINDDLGALTDLPQRIGRGAALKLNGVFWTEFLNNASFFTSGNANYITGSTTVLGSEGLRKAVETFRKMTDPDSQPIAVTPRILLVPPELESVALELYTSTNNNTGGSSTTDRVPNGNIFAGRYRPEVTPYLSNTSYTGYSTTAFYLLADPADEPVIEVAFLNGQEAPTVETAEADFSVLGVQMRGYHDFGVAKQSTRGGVKSKGAA